MNLKMIIALLLIAGGIWGLMYGGFSFVTDTHNASIGPLSFSVNETESVNIPSWAGVAGIVAGALMLVMGNKK